MHLDDSFTTTESLEDIERQTSSIFNEFDPLINFNKMFEEDKNDKKESDN